MKTTNVQNQNNVEFLMLLFKKTLFKFKKNKWWLLMLGVMGAAVWFELYDEILIPKYSAKALMKVEISEDPLQISSRRYERNQEYSILGIINTRRFLGKVVDSLKLQFKLKGNAYFRSQIFDDVDYIDEKQYGLYEFVRNDEGILQILYTNKGKNIENQLVYEGDIRDSINIKNIKIIFNETFLLNNPTFKFTAVFIPREAIIAKIKKNLHPLFINRQQFIEINYKDTDRYLAQDITNVIADQFVKENVELKTLKTKKLIENLENQLVTAEEKLRNAEEALKDFRRQHPTVVLTGGARTEINSMNNLQSSVSDLRRGAEQLDESLQKLNTSVELSDKMLAARELLNIANNLGYSVATVLTDNLNDESRNYADVLVQYPEEHQYVLDAKKQIFNLLQNISTFAQNTINELYSQIESGSRRISALESELKRLPAAELKLARLTRDRDIANNIYTHIKERYNNAKVVEETESPDVFIIDLALLPMPAQKLFLLAGKYGGMLMVFLVIPFIIAFVMAYFDKTVMTKKELEKELSPKFIGAVPTIGELNDIPASGQLNKRKRMDPKLTTIDYSPSVANEAFRQIRTSLMHQMDYLKKKKVLQVTSFAPGEGKSLIVANIAITFAQNKIPTLLIDADLRRGVLHNMLLVKKTPGLSNLLASNVQITSAVVEKVIQKSQIPNLFILSCGDPLPNPAELLSSMRMAKLLQVVKNNFGAVIMDTAPVGVASDTMNMLNKVDATLLVTMAQKTKINQIVNIYKKIENVDKENVIGIVLNGADDDLNKSDYSYSYYHY